MAILCFTATETIHREINHDRNFSFYVEIKVTVWGKRGRETVPLEVQN